MQISPAFKIGKTVIIRPEHQKGGDGQRKLYGHTCYVRLDVPKVIKALPVPPKEFQELTSDVPQSPLTVVLSSKLSKQQQQKFTRTYEAHPGVIRKLLATLKGNNNHIYKDIQVNDTALKEYVDGHVPAGIIREVEEKEEKKTNKKTMLNEAFDNCRKKRKKDVAMPASIVDHDDDDDEDGEEITRQRASATTSSFGTGLSVENLRYVASLLREQAIPATDENKDEKKNNQTIEVEPSREFVDQRSKDWYYYAFPHLFPFGVGGPGEHHPNPISLEETLDHYCR